jgi:hydrogenase maturation protease
MSRRVVAVAVRALPLELLAGAEVRIVPAVTVEDLVALPPDAQVVIVDAVVGPPPGQLVELALADLATGAVRAVATSSHQLPLPEVVALAGLLRDAPLQGRFVGIGIGSVAFGSQLSEPVAAAVPVLADAVARAIMATAGRDTLPP